MFDSIRMRRLRVNRNIRNLVSEVEVPVSKLVQPLFVVPGKGQRQPIASMPGQFRFSMDRLVQEVDELQNCGITSVILFGIPPKKNSKGSGAYDANGIVQKALQALRKRFPELILIADVCLCEYTSHGHCGVLRPTKGGGYDVDNDSTLALLSKTAVSLARAGADIVAPSDMMDHRVAAIRQALDGASYKHVSILSYAAKYQSAFYGPFREAAESAPAQSDRSTYQMDIRNGDEAMREIELDLREGADMVMVKPALAYLDVIRRAKEKFACPLAAYNVSGEYAMVKAGAAQGWLDERRVVTEILTSIRRAGADFILTYHAKDFARWARQARP